MEDFWHGMEDFRYGMELYGRFFLLWKLEDLYSIPSHSMPWWLCAHITRVPKVVLSCSKAQKMGQVF